MSRAEKPKQLLALTGERTLLQEAALRASDASIFEPLIVVTGASQLALVREQLREIGARVAQFIVEPMPRDTGPAVAAAALFAGEASPDALVLILPTDHRIADVAKFHAAISAGAETAERGKLILFGMRPDHPADGYGYVRVGEKLPEEEDLFAVAAFVEKPDEETAKRYLDGGYCWNSGIFLMLARSLLTELARYEPEILRHVREAVLKASREGDSLTLDAQCFARCQPISFDRAVMERTGEAAVVRAEFGWTDVGSWSTLWEIGERDEANNVTVGEVLTEGTSDSYVRSDGPIIATVGVSNLIVVATPDAVLVADKRRGQDIKKIVDRLKARKLDLG